MKGGVRVRAELWGKSRLDTPWDCEDICREMWRDVTWQVQARGCTQGWQFSTCGQISVKIFTALFYTQKSLEYDLY